MDGDERGGGHPHLILASASPRRREILSAAWAGRLTPLSSGVEEGGPLAGEPGGRYAVRMAAAKCLGTARAHPGRLVVAADTIVELDGRVLGKPKGENEARGMLTALRGREHSVTTGLAVASARSAEPELGSETTLVRMRCYSDREIAAYVASGEPFDKAGGYAVQDEGLAPAERVTGCYLNVVGLPLCRLAGLLARAVPGAERALMPGGCAPCMAATDAT